MARSHQPNLNPLHSHPLTIRLGLRDLAQQFENIKEAWIEGDRELTKMMASGMEPCTSGYAEIGRNEVRYEVHCLLFKLKDDIIPFVLPHCDHSLRDRVQKLIRLLELDTYQADRYGEKKERWRQTWPAMDLDPMMEELLPMLRARGDEIMIAEIPSSAGTNDDELYKPASWFTGQPDCKIPAARLRKAGAPERKSKRVRTRRVDGTVLYSVADARRWWPGDMPKT